jgi:RES domain-containing protein
MLEYFVHIDKDDPPRDLILSVAELPDDLSRKHIDVSRLPANWRDPAAPPQLARFGDEFWQDGEQCLLLVPSVIAPSENNCLINPGHADFKRIVIHELERLRYDPRMFGRPQRQHSKHG